MKSAVTQRPKAEGSLKEWALLLYHAAWYTWRKGSVTEAIDLSEIAMKVRKKTLGQEHNKTLSNISMVGLAYSLGGRWKEAEELEVQVMETRQKVLGEEHPDTLTIMNNLAFTWEGQGRAAEAISLMDRCVQLRKKVLGPEHPHTEASLETLRGWEGRIHE